MKFKFGHFAHFGNWHSANWQFCYMTFCHLGCPRSIHITCHFSTFQPNVAILGCQCLQITNLMVPSVYEITNSSNADDLILDCEYELEGKEPGFVLKWLFNNQLIYQWIPNHKPHALVSMWKMAYIWIFSIKFHVSSSRLWKVASILRLLLLQTKPMNTAQFWSVSPSGTWLENTHVMFKHSSHRTRSRHTCKSLVSTDLF